MLVALGDVAEAVARFLARLVFEIVLEALISLVPNQVARWYAIGAVALIFGCILYAATRWMMSPI